MHSNQDGQALIASNLLKWYLNILKDKFIFKEHGGGHGTAEEE
jgi:hypothetical protein